MDVMTEIQRMAAYVRIVTSAAIVLIMIETIRVALMFVFWLLISIEIIGSMCIDMRLHRLVLRRYKLFMSHLSKCCLIVGPFQFEANLGIFVDDVGQLYAFPDQLDRDLPHLHRIDMLLGSGEESRYTVCSSVHQPEERAVSLLVESPIIFVTIGEDLSCSARLFLNREKCHCILCWMWGRIYLSSLRANRLSRYCIAVTSEVSEHDIERYGIECWSAILSITKYESDPRYNCFIKKYLERLSDHCIMSKPNSSSNGNSIRVDRSWIARMMSQRCEFIKSETREINIFPCSKYRIIHVLSMRGATVFCLLMAWSLVCIALSCLFGTTIAYSIFISSAISAWMIAVVERKAFNSMIFEELVGEHIKDIESNPMNGEDNDPFQCGSYAINCSENYSRESSEAFAGGSSITSFNRNSYVFPSSNSTISLLRRGPLLLRRWAMLDSRRDDEEAKISAMMGDDMLRRTLGLN